MACDVCGKYICAPSCPSYAGKRIGYGEILGICVICKRAIYANEKYVRKPEMIFCEECYEQASFYSIRKFLKKENL